MDNWICWYNSRFLILVLLVYQKEVIGYGLDWQLNYTFGLWVIFNHMSLKTMQLIFVYLHIHRLITDYMCLHYLFISKFFSSAPGSFLKDHFIMSRPLPLQLWCTGELPQYPLLQYAICVQEMVLLLESIIFSVLMIGFWHCFSCTKIFLRKEKESNKKIFVRSKADILLHLDSFNSVKWHLLVLFSISCSGMADIVGRRFGSKKIPYNRNKSLAGSIAMASAGFLASIG